MKVFIAATSCRLALQAKAVLVAAGHTVTSTWHEAELKRTVTYSAAERKIGANRNIFEVTASDALLLLTPEGNTPGGLWVEAGVAIGQNKPVYSVGLRPGGTRGNFNMYHHMVSQYATVEEAVLAMNT